MHTSREQEAFSLGRQITVSLETAENNENKVVLLSSMCCLLWRKVLAQSQHETLCFGVIGAKDAQFPTLHLLEFNKCDV